MDFLSLFKKNSKADVVAELLKISSQARAEFEEKYRSEALDDISDNFFEVNSRQAADVYLKDEAELNTEQKELIKRICAELMNEVKLYHYEKGRGSYERHGDGLPDREHCVGIADIKKAFPDIKKAPQLAGLLQKKDIKGDSATILFETLKSSMDETKTPDQRMLAYHMFRQGLDILDIDPILYETLGCNKNAMGYWLPKIVYAAERHNFFQIPTTTIMKVPMTMLQLTRLGYEQLTRTSLDIVDEVCREAFDLDEEKEYFIKTGTYSSKFDFRNAYVHDPKEVREIGEYLLFIHSQANEMAGPLTQPCIYGVSTTNEWVVREYIRDMENNPRIYKGLPLHTEYRVFVDFETDEVLGITPYWEPETMKKRFGEGADHNVHDFHDYVIYKNHEPVLMSRYENNKDRIVREVEKILPDIKLPGQWSIDIMQNGDDFWIIDMALAETSAFYKECVPVDKRHPLPEDWIPKIEVKDE